MTAFVIKDIAADRSDAGAEGAIEAFEGGTGGGGKGIGNMEEVGTNLNELVVQEYLPEQEDSPGV